MGNAAISAQVQVVLVGAQLHAGFLDPRLQHLSRVKRLAVWVAVTRSRHMERSILIGRWNEPGASCGD